jgi:hypothetical protein
MADQLQATSINAPGFFGLNTQESEVTLEKGFAVRAENCVIDNFGRLGARKGWQFLAETSDINLLGIHRFIDIDGTEYFGCWSDDTFYIYSGGTLTEVTYSGSQVFADGNWQAITLNDSAYLFQRGYEPLYFDVQANAVKDINQHPNSSGVAPQGNTALAAYGRIWVADTNDNKTTLYWSDLLDGPDWNSGTSGSLDISGILVYGNDVIVGLGAHNGYLIVFCKRNIIIFGDTEADQQYLDPTTLQLVEVINGVGCIARDSIQNTGTDILFLSTSGVRSLGRTIQEKSQPMRDISKNVRDDLVRVTQAIDVDTIKSCYSENNAFYLLALTGRNEVYCFDMRMPLQDGSARVTTWTTSPFTSWIAFSGEVYMTHADGLARYYGYTDNDSSYTMKYYTPYSDLGSPSSTKILKRIAVTIIGTQGQDFHLYASYDYEDIYTPYDLNLVEGDKSEYDEHPALSGNSSSTMSATQSATTVTSEGAPTVHYNLDFSATETGAYTEALTIYLDADTYYYFDQDEGSTRTATTVYIQPYLNGDGESVSGKTSLDEYNVATYTGTIVDNVRVAGSGSGTVLQFGFEAVLGGGEISLQKIDMYVKQGRIL